MTTAGTLHCEWGTFGPTTEIEQTIRERGELARIGSMNGSLTGLASGNVEGDTVAVGGARALCGGLERFPKSLELCGTMCAGILVTGSFGQASALGIDDETAMWITDHVIDDGAIGEAGSIGSVGVPVVIGASIEVVAAAEVLGIVGARVASIDDPVSVLVLIDLLHFTAAQQRQCGITALPRATRDAPWDLPTHTNLWWGTRADSRAVRRDCRG